MSTSPPLTIRRRTMAASPLSRQACCFMLSCAALFQLPAAHCCVQPCVIIEFQAMRVVSIPRRCLSCCAGNGAHPRHRGRRQDSHRWGFLACRACTDQRAPPEELLRLFHASAACATMFRSGTEPSRRHTNHLCHALPPPLLHPADVEVFRRLYEEVSCWQVEGVCSTLHASTCKLGPVVGRHPSSVAACSRLTSWSMCTWSCPCAAGRAGLGLRHHQEQDR